MWCGQTQTSLETHIEKASTIVADNRKVEDSEAKALKDKLKEEHNAGDLLFSILGIHVLAGREEPIHLPTLLSNAGICMLLCLC